MALAPLLEASPGVAVQVLAALLLCVGQGATPPRREALDHALAAITDGRACALAGCRMEVKDGVLKLARARPRQGRAIAPNTPVPWIVQRFRAACGLYPAEASIPPPC